MAPHSSSTGNQLVCCPSCFLSTTTHSTKRSTTDSSCVPANHGGETPKPNGHSSWSRRENLLRSADPTLSWVWIFWSPKPLVRLPTENPIFRNCKIRSISVRTPDDLKGTGFVTCYHKIYRKLHYSYLPRCRRNPN
jgi:hypothetical protein